MWFAFTFFGFLWSFIAQQLRISDLEGAAKPYLSLVFGRGEQLYDSLHHEGGLRILRVGVRNSGASVQDVAVKVTRIEPSLPRVFPMQELQRTHAADGVARFTVNKSDEPLVFVDVIHQRIFTSSGTIKGSRDGIAYEKPYQKGETSSMSFAFANGQREIPADRKHYFVWLGIDGAGAEPPRKFVLSRNDNGQYDLNESLF